MAEEDKLEFKCPACGEGPIRVQGKIITEYHDAVCDFEVLLVDGKVRREEVAVNGSWYVDTETTKLVCLTCKHEFSSVFEVSPSNDDMACDILTEISNVCMPS